MSTLTLASLAALTPVGVAAPRARGCPTLSVSCPEVVSPRLPLTFNVNVGEVPADAKLTFNWIIPAGTIMSGQGTRIERVQKYLTTVRAVPAERLAAIDGGYREALTVELSIRVTGMSPPELVPTVDPSEVIFIKPAPQRRARRR